MSNNPKTTKFSHNADFIPSFLNLKFLYIVIINSVFYALVRFLNLWEFLIHFAKSFLFDFWLLFVLCFCAQKLSAKIAQSTTHKIVHKLPQNALDFMLNVLFGLSFIVGAINVFLFINFNSTLNLASFEIFLATNLRESGEFSLFYANAKSIVLLLVFIALSIVCAKSKYAMIPPKPVSAFVALASVVFVCIFAIKCYKGGGFGFLDTQMSNKSEIYHFAKVIYTGLYDESEVIKEFRELDKKLDSMLALRGGGSDFTEYANSTQNLSKNLTSNPIKTTYISQKRKIPKIVLIIGESTQRNYMNLYGYPLPNNPNLNALVKSQNLFVFSDVISPAADTAQVLKKVLSFSNYENEGKIKWYQTMNLIDAMKLLGYHTYWISNQEAVSGHNSFDILAKRVDTLRYARLMESNPRALQDEVLLKIYDDLKQKKAQNQHTDFIHSDNPNQNYPPKHQNNEFIIFHLQGTHYIYKWRYSDEFDSFSAKDLRINGLDMFYAGEKKSQTINNRQAEIKANYLNAILYNDFVVSEIIKRFDEQKSSTHKNAKLDENLNEEVIIFYLSDHGEEVYDKGDFAGHGGNIASRFALEIPFMIYVNDAFKRAYPNVINRIKQAQNLPFMSDNFMHAMFDLLNISCADCKPSLSPFNPQYNLNRERMIKIGDREINYDKEIKND